MSNTTSLFKSSLGMKYVMAVTGVILFLFVVGHLVGNLQVLAAPELINNYAYFLQSKPLLVWGARFGLLLVIGLHIFSAFQLAAMNRSARAVRYATDPTYGSSWQSRHMMLTGIVTGLFIIYHLAHFTVLLPGVNGVGDFRELKTTLPGGLEGHDVYGMMVLGFQVWWVSLFYIIAQAFLFLHLNHGLSALFQSLGLRNHLWWPRIRRFAVVTSAIIFVGYALIPGLIFMRVIGADYAEKLRLEMKSARVETPGALAKEAN